MTTIKPLLLKHAPALIEAVFPAQKLSYEAQRERKAGSGQTLTGLGSYWKGRKPLILARAIILGSLLPQTDNKEKDLEIFELLMGFDACSLAKRALKNSKITTIDIATSINLVQPWRYFSHNITSNNKDFTTINQLNFPLSKQFAKLKISWRTDITEEDKLKLIKKYLKKQLSYEAKAILTKRPEELDQSWLYEHIWQQVNQHYAEFSINASSHQQLVEQLGILRYGNRPKVGDVFAGGGSIPFEAARLGCDAYASDLNPVACMLTWGAFNIIGASAKRKATIEQAQQQVATQVDAEITKLGIEHDSQGNRAKNYLYCLEARCPETGWMVPLAPSWVISQPNKVVAVLEPNYQKKCFDIQIITGATNAQMQQATQGTVQKGYMVYSLDGKPHHTPIKTIRGDYKADGTNKNKLRQWQQTDFMPHKDDIFQERLYCIQWLDHKTLNTKTPKTFFAAVTAEDITREHKVEQIVAKNIVSWQAEGLIPNMEINPGSSTYEPIRTRGWRYWHQLFHPHLLLLFATVKKYIIKTNEPSILLGVCSSLNKGGSKLCRWDKASNKNQDVFYNQLLNTLYNYSTRGFIGLKKLLFFNPETIALLGNNTLININANKITKTNDLWITDPPYADAVHYHEITEYFIAWLRNNPPQEFANWTWDSRRALAIKGAGDDFRREMVKSYKAMAKHMPANGMQCVMFTHQSTSVWADIIGIFWAAGLQVVSAWYIATETASELKKGGYVQGTVILMLRKRQAEDMHGFEEDILPVVRVEVARQITTMLHLNQQRKNKLGEPVFNDADLQMAGYAAALKVLTAYTHIEGEDITNFALKPRKKGEVTVVDDIVGQAEETANDLLIPDGLKKSWSKIQGIQRFYLKMLDIETTGAAKLDNYQNFAKIFKVEDYTKVMASTKANSAKLYSIAKFPKRSLNPSSEIGGSYLGELIIALQMVLKDIAASKKAVDLLRHEVTDFVEVRPILIEILRFIATKDACTTTREAAEVLADSLTNISAFG